jgi:hypothetical protein
VLQVPVRAEDLRFRQPNQDLQCVITKITEPVDYYGEQRQVYEFDYDLTGAPLEEPITIDIEILLDYHRSDRAPFVTHTRTDMVSVWLLFPANRPYRTYSLMSYPVDGSQPPSLMKPRYDINHPYGSLIGWSVVNPEENYVYECRWVQE